MDVRTEPVYRSLLGSLFSDQFGLKFLLNEIVSMIYVSGIVLENFARNAKLKKKKKGVTLHFSEILRVIA